MLTFNFGDNILSSTFQNVLKKLKNVACEQKTSVCNQLVGTIVLVLVFLMADFSRYFQYMRKALKNSEFQ